MRVADRVDGDDSDAKGRGYYVQDAGYPGFLNWLMELSQLRSVVSRSTQALTISTADLPARPSPGSSVR